jgi:hypothetical protein
LLAPPLLQFHIIAECVRAFVEVNDPHSLWPRATRERLWSIDPRMAAIVASLFEFDHTA